MHTHELLILRHAKSDWGSIVTDDFSRPLAPRGERDVVVIASAIKENGWIPDGVYSSPALRAKTTAECVCNITGFPLNEIDWDNQIYAASMTTLLRLLTQTEESIFRVMLVGHNPGLEYLLAYLCPDAQAQPDGKLFTTCNIARIGIQSRWSELAPSYSTLRNHLRPKEL